MRLANKAKFTSDERKEYLIDVWKELHTGATLALGSNKYVYKIKMYDIETKKIIHDFTTNWVDFKRYGGDVDYAINEMLFRYRVEQEHKQKEEKYLYKEVK